MWLLPVSILVTAAVLSVPLSRYLAWIMEGQYHAPRLLRWFEERLDTGPQDWKQYTAALLIFNAVLFIMIGLELLRLDFVPTYAWAGLLAIPAVLAARFLSVGIAAVVPGLRQDFPPRVIAILTWGGLRGGISVALALSLPSGAPRDAIITVTYAVVIFSILVQGLTLSRLLRRAGA